MLVCAGDVLLVPSETALCSCIRILNPNSVHLSAPLDDPRAGLWLCTNLSSQVH